MYQSNPERRLDMVEQAIRRFRLEGCALLPEQLAIYRHLAQRLRGRRVLDVGCGIGIGTNVLAHWGCRVVGIDHDTKNVAFARAMYPDTAFEVWDITRGPIDPVVDAVVAVEVIEHIEDDRAAMAHLLASGQTLILSTPNRANPSLGQDRPLNDCHVREYTPTEVLGRLDGHVVVIRDPYSWRTVPADTLMTPLVYEVTHAR